MNFEVKVEETDHTWVERNILGWKWWWCVRLEGRWAGSKSNFARTERGALKAAERAAEKMAMEPCEPRVEYSFKMEV